MGVNCIMANEITTPMEPSGRVLPLFRGDYSDSMVYENPDIVLYENSSYVAKQTTVGNPPPKNSSSNDFWQMIAKGIIYGDISDSTIEFDEAQERKNIKSGEKSNVIMGKIMKFFTDLKNVAFTGSYTDLIEKPGVVSKLSDGFVPQLPNETATKKYLRQDGTWATPPDTNTQAVASVNNKTGVVTLTAADVKAIPTSDKIDKLNNIGQITRLGYWAISAIDNTYAASIGVDNNTGDFHALVLSYNGNGTNSFNFGTIILSSPRLGAYHYVIQVWEGTAHAERMLNFADVTNSTAVNITGKKALDAIEKNPSVAGTLANQLSQVNSKIMYLNPLSIYYVPIGNEYINDLYNIIHPLIFIHLENNADGDNASDAYWCIILTLRSGDYFVQLGFSLNTDTIKMRSKSNDSLLTKWRQINLAHS